MKKLNELNNNHIALIISVFFILGFVFGFNMNYLDNSPTITQQQVKNEQKVACTNMFLIIDEYLNYSLLEEMGHLESEGLRARCYQQSPYIINLEKLED